jgi:ribosomal protein S19
MGRLMGIEPTYVGSTIRCVNHFATAAKSRYIKICMGRLMGIEPTYVGSTIRCVNHFATVAKIS